MTKFLSIKELLPDDFTDDASSLPAWRMTAATWWAISRILHGALWLAVIAYYFYFWIDPKDHFNQLGQLRFSTEVLMFGLPMAAVCMGFFSNGNAGSRRGSTTPRTDNPAEIVPGGPPGGRSRLALALTSPIVSDQILKRALIGSNQEDYGLMPHFARIFFIAFASLAASCSSERAKGGGGEEGAWSATDRGVLLLCTNVIRLDAANNGGSQHGNRSGF